MQISSADISFNVCCHGNGRQTEQDVKLIYCFIFSKLVLFSNCWCQSDLKQRTWSTCVRVDFWVYNLNRQFFSLSFFLPFPGCLCVCGARQTLGVRVLSVHLSLPPALPCSPCFSCCCVSFPFVLILPLPPPPQQLPSFISRAVVPQRG